MSLGLDIATRKQCSGRLVAHPLLQKINELGTTVLIVTHEKELVNAFSKRVITLENGTIVSDGTGGYYGQ